MTFEELEARLSRPSRPSDLLLDRYVVGAFSDEARAAVDAQLRARPDLADEVFGRDSSYTSMPGVAREVLLSRIAVRLGERAARRRCATVLLAFAVAFASTLWALMRLFPGDAPPG